jgi:hypothetical protein
MTTKALAEMQKWLEHQIEYGHAPDGYPIDVLIPVISVVVYSYRGIAWGVAAMFLSILLLRGAEGFIWGSRNR